MSGMAFLRELLEPVAGARAAPYHFAARLSPQLMRRGRAVDKDGGNPKAVTSGIISLSPFFTGRGLG